MCEDLRMIFEVDYADYSDDSVHTLTIPQELLLALNNDSYLKSLPAETYKALVQFVISCVFIAQKTRSEFSLFLSENCETATVTLSAYVLFFDEEALVLLKTVISAAENMTIIPSVDEGGDTMVCIDILLSDKGISE